ncbi:MAG: bifunctional diaminohydroxyphosphoribosylaminopyrimidine deaminase/5-amino-6-(5-phosphoribosylamino)uracil reductase RibD [Phycisphaerae bacterium]
MARDRAGRSVVEPQAVVDARMMNRAIKLARRGEGRVEPNPMVGCVVTRGGRIVSEGYHRRFAGPHAEIEALSACANPPRGSTVYVSLEPCCHQGKTPPCTDALINAGVSRVVAAVHDPSPTAGDGVRRMRRAGIAVEVGLLAGESAEVLAPFLTRVCLRRPFVIAKWAQSLDGKLATHTGQSRWISCESSRRRVHHLRARVDAILVGSGTVAADNPMLTARDVPLRRRALRVVLDGRLRISEKCHLVTTAREFPTIVFTSARTAGTSKAELLALKGVELVTCRENRCRQLVLGECLKELAHRGVTNLLVEGGPTVLTSFFELGLVDEAFVFTAPVLIGGREAPTAFGGHGARRIDEGITAQSINTSRCGVDTLHRIRLRDPRELVRLTLSV